MYLYNLTLQKPTAITCSIEGNFSSDGTQVSKEKELLVARGRILELLKLDVDNSRLISVFSQDVFGVIRDMIPFRLTGSKKDFIIIGSDSGRISILEYDKKRNNFKKVHEETFGRSGCRRIVPGQFLAADPKGRAIMIAAVEKQKFVYILNRDSSAKLTISSPLEAHKSRTLCFSMIGVDVGYNNPIFASIEVDYGENEESENEEIKKQLVYYELDLGLNHVVRQWSSEIDPTSNQLITVPGGKEGPGGVLVCAENFIYWKNMDHQDVHASIPRRSDMDESKGLLIVSHTIFKRRDMFFFLLQSEFGDLYKVELYWENDTQVKSISIKYFDTVPVASSLTVILPAYLFVASESGNQILFQFIGTGEDQQDSSNPAIKLEKIEDISNQMSDFEVFKPRSIKNLDIFEQYESLSPILAMQIKDITREMTPQIYTLCGSGISSSLRVLRHGLEVTEMAVTQLPGNALSVWTVKKTRKDKFDSYIIISFPDSTLVLSIGNNVEEVSEAESGFLESSPTLFVRQIGEDGLLQIIPSSIRHIRAGKRVSEWRTPGKKQILHATANQQQVVVSLTGGELYYFQLDPNSNLLVEMGKKEMGFEISCLDISPIPSGRLLANFLAVGDWENTIRILSLETNDCLQTLTMQSLPSQPIALCLIYMKNEGDLGTLFLNIGLQDGVLLRICVDSISGDLSDVRRRFLGVKPVKMFKITVCGQPAMLALSSRTWIAYNYQSRFHLTPLSYIPLESASSFSSEQCPEGIVSVTNEHLRIISVERLGEIFNQKQIQLKYTPRKFIIHSPTNHFIIIEAEHNSLSTSDLPFDSYNSHQDPSTSNNIDPDNDDEPNTDVKFISRPKPGSGKWASCIRIFNPVENKTVDFIELKENEAAFSICQVTFQDRKNETYIVVGTTKNFVLAPRKIECGYLHVYKLNVIENSLKLEFIHKTQVEEIPGALCAFQGRLLAGIGKVLRIYDLGKRKLLRKCENKGFPRMIKSIQTQGDRIVVGDLSESFHFVKYKRYENQLFIFADDTSPRWVTAGCMLDYDTVAGGDKFGNIFICRLPKEVAEDVEDDPTAAHLQHVSTMKGAPHKLSEIIQFHVGEPITHLTKASLVPGGASILIYSTIHGAIGALVPFVSRDDVDFFTRLEMYMRQNLPPLCGRDHMAYRSYYFPVKNVLDGDLCEQFNLLDSQKQTSIAEELNRSVGEVLKKLEDLRNRCL